jgi:hypothetical protein
MAEEGKQEVTRGKAGERKKRSEKEEEKEEKKRAGESEGRSLKLPR